MAPGIATRLAVQGGVSRSVVNGARNRDTAEGEFVGEFSLFPLALTCRTVASITSALAQAGRTNKEMQ